MKKILLVLHNADGGGAEKVIIAIANKLAENFDVTLFLFKKKGAFLNNISDNVNLIGYNGLGIISIIRFILLIRRNCYNSILTTLTHINIIVVGLKNIAKNSPKVIIREASTYENVLSNNNLILKYFSIFFRGLYKKADHVIAISDAVKNDLIKYYSLPEDLIRVIYNPLIESQNKSPNIDQVHSWLSNKHHFVVLSAGRFVESKDHITLIKAVHHLSKTLNIKLIILGDGTLREIYEQYISDFNLQNTIILPGFVSNVDEWMRLADLFVLPSKWEGFGNVLVECLKENTQLLVASNSGGPIEIIEEGKYGLIFEKGNHLSCANNILKFYEGLRFDDLIIRSKKYSFDHIYKDYLSLVN